MAAVKAHSTVADSHKVNVAVDCVVLGQVLQVVLDGLIDGPVLLVFQESSLDLGDPVLFSFILHVLGDCVGRRHTALFDTDDD